MSWIQENHLNQKVLLHFFFFLGSRVLQTKILQPRKLTVACFQKLRVVLKQTERSLEPALSAACFF